MEIFYCEQCGSRITEGEIDAGDALLNGPSIYCLACVQADPELERVWRETSRSAIPAAKKKLGKRARRMRKPRADAQAKSSATVFGAVAGFGLALVIALIMVGGGGSSRPKPKSAASNGSRDVTEHIEDANVWRGEKHTPSVARPSAPPDDDEATGFSVEAETPEAEVVDAGEGDLEQPRAAAPSTSPEAKASNWGPFLREMAAAGRRGLPEALRLEREKAPAFTDPSLVARLERMRQRLRDAERVEPFMMEFMQEVPDTRRMHVGDRPISGKILDVVDRTIKLKPVVGDTMDVAFDEVDPADIVALAGLDKGIEADRMRAARYCLVRGDPRAAAKLAEYATGPEADLLREDIEELSDLVTAAKEKDGNEAPAEVATASETVAPVEAEPAVIDAAALRDVVLPKPIAWWRFDEGTGGKARDASGNGLSGDLVDMLSSEAWVVGVSDLALRFDGLDDRVVVPRAFAPPPAGTVSFWVKRAGALSGERIMGGHDAYEVRFLEDGRLDHQFCSAGTTTLKSTTKLDAGSWYHVALTYDSASKESRIFVNGALDARGQFADDLPGSLTFALGTRTGKGDDFFKGALDDVRIYDEALSPTQVASLSAALGQNPGSPDVTYAPGLSGAYYTALEPGGLEPRAVRIDEKLHVTWTRELLPRGIGIHVFSIRWTGELLIPKAGTYTLKLAHNDGVRLWIADRPVMSNWTQAVREDSCKVKLPAGWLPVRVEYFQQKKAAHIRLNWSGPGLAMRPVESKFLRTRRLQADR